MYKYVCIYIYIYIYTYIGLTRTPNPIRRYRPASSQLGLTRDIYIGFTPLKHKNSPVVPTPSVDVN